MGDVLDQIEQTFQDLHDWFYLVAITLVWLSVVATVTAGFVVWGMLRIAKLVEINMNPRNPPPSSSYVVAQQHAEQRAQQHGGYGPHP